MIRWLAERQCPDKFGNHRKTGVTHLVVVPYDSLTLVENKIVLPGGTKDTLKMLPEFKCAAK
jgi:hypothetical protein